MEWSEVLSLINNAQIYGGNGQASYGDQWRNANASMRALRDNYNTVADDGMSKEQYNAAMSGLKSQKMNAGVGAALSIANGLSTIGANAISAARINDTPEYDRAISEIGTAGLSQYSNPYQLNTDMAKLNNVPTFDRMAIRSSDGDRVKGLLGSAATGAQAGMAFGPWGAAIGAGLGAGIYGLGIHRNNLATNAKMRQYNTDLAYAQNAGYKNTFAQQEGYSDYAFRNGVANSNTAGRPSAMGGPIKRELSLKEFSDRVMKRAKANDVTRSAGISRQYCKGGVKIKIHR